ncbi:hypothetical protein TTHERM_00919640 (macronuclear) [Tetrahymena thermophila SB210]|uniref:Uncharacterized protein n=1 Tax=Tetrahymena thermophila (strain SB210) TaxID=312017 RepID=Q24IL0_TETTS|nr:hypothetical protein TTHERM_00919640 [Tetrahymena thermophila SB210]EAS07615.2 hypothetical protein TTHERM_00919640 [Tetrahymena thermophila SB210]|eukprot:XP_001027857.2 hypothetical protein TTHERM_00919640 [Tetrahymena thermophila SB210]
MNYINAGFASVFTIPFKLDSGISSSDYFKLVFPFKLHNQEQYGTPNGNIPVNLIASYAVASGGYLCGTGNYINAQVNINVVNGQNQEPTAYYISFQDVLGNPISLLANQYYYLKLQLTGSNVNVQSPGIKVPIQAYTVSSISSIAIVYDRNPSFTNIALGDYPLMDLQLTVTILNQNTANMIGALNTVYVDVGVKQQIQDQARIEIKFLNNDFTFNTNCSTGSQLQNPYIPPLPSSQYKCVYDPSQNTITYSILRTVNANEMFRFVVNVQNPNYVPQQAYLQVRTLLFNQNNIVEIQNSNSIFSVNQIQFSSQNMQLGWGLEYSSSAFSFYPFNLQVLRQSNQNPDFIPYNAFQWLFKISQDLPDNIRVQVQIQVPNKLKTFVLPGSISNTLPSYTGLNVYCYLNTLTDPTQSVIICENVGKMLASTQYTIGCRITFPYDLFTSPLEPNFGTITLYAVDINSGNQIGQALSVSQNALQIVSTNNNQNWSIGTTNNLDYTLFSTAALTDTVNSANLNILGAVPSASSTTLQQFIFTMKIPSTTITSTVGNIPNGAGLIILANPNVISLQASDSPTITTSNDSQLQSPLNLFTSVQISERASYLKIKITSFNSQDLDLIFNGSSPNCYFKINRGRVIRHSSYYADQYLMDFYIATFDQINSPNPILKNVFLYNAYTINTGGPANIRYGVSNYMTKATPTDGTQLPVILRIAGYFSASDLGSARTKIAIFFKNLEPFYSNSNSNYNIQIPCFSSLTTQYTCSYFTSGQNGGIVQGQSYANYHRIEIQFQKIPTGASEKFQLIIPLKAFANKQNSNVIIYLAGLQTSNLYSSNSNLNQITSIYRLTGKNNIVPSNQLFQNIIAASQTTGSYNWVLASGSRVGLMNTNLQFKIKSNTVINGNKQSIPYLNGASFTLCSEWNYYTASSTASFPLGSQDSTGSCLSFSYPLSFTGTTPNYRYGVYCPYEQGSITISTILQISYAFLPYINGNMPPSKNMLAWSNNDGILSENQFGVTGFTAMTLGKIIVAPVTKSLTVGRQREYFSVQFTTQNPIVSGNQITLTFNTAAAFTDFSLQTVANPCKLSEMNTGIQQATCSASINSANKQLNVIITNCQNCLKSGGSTYTLTIYGIQMNNPAITPPTKFGITLYASSAATPLLIVDQSASINGAQPLTYINSSPATDPTIVFQNLYMGCQNQRCRTLMYFSVTFTNRIVAVDEQLILSLGGYAKDNVVYQSNLVCQIQNPIVAPSTIGTPSFSWLSMDTTTLSQILIIPKKEIPANSQFLFYCDGIRTPYSINPAQINGFISPQGSVLQIYSGFLSSTVYSQIKPQSLFPSNNLAVQYKQHNTVGSSVVFNFNITSEKINIVSSTNILINFPTTYSPLLTSSYIYCLMNNVFVSCQIVMPYTILITSLPFSITVNKFFNIQVFGVEQSSIFYSNYMSIFVGISNQASYTILDEFGDANDIQPSTTPQRVWITKLSVSNNYIRNTANYALKVKVPAGSVVQGNYFYIDFPVVWDRIINYITPLCFLYNPLNTTDYSTDCQTFGNRITIPVIQTDQNANNFYYIVLQNLRNPDQIACDAGKMIISISQNNGNSIASRSSSNLWNIVGLPFQNNPSQINLNWVDPNTGLAITQVSAYVGIFNNLVTVGSDYGAFLKAFYIKTSNNQFSLSPAQPTASLGYPTAQFQIAANSTTTQGLFLVQLQKSDDQGAQTALPFLKIQVIAQKFSLNVQDLVFKIPVSGHSLPILIDMLNCQSLYDTLLQGTLFDPTTPLQSAAGLNFVNKSNIILNYNNPQAFYMVSSNPNSAVLNSNGQINIVLTTQALQFYNSFPQLTYQIIPDKTIAPKAQLQISSTSTDKGATHLKIVIGCNQDSTFYYVASIYGAQNVSPQFVIQNAWSFTISNLLNDPYNYHYGFTNIILGSGQVENVDFQTKTVQVNKLKPSTNYNITGFCVNGNDLFSSSQTIQVTTKGNSGIFLTISFTFSQVVLQDMAKQFACFLTSYLKVPAPYLRTQYNDYCDLTTGSRILSQNQQFQNQNFLAKEIEQNFENRFLDSSNSGQSGQTQTTKIYIYPIYEFEKDTITPQIQINGINQNLLTTYAYGNITGLPSITSVSQPTLGDYLIPNIVNQTFIIANPGLDNVNITGLQCDSYCVFYGMVDLASVPTPTYYDIRTGYQGKSSSNATFQFSQKTYSNSILYFSFSNLQKNTMYSFFYYSAADDPSIFQPRTQVYTVQFSTSQPDTQSSMIISFKLLVVILLFYIQLI